MPEQTKLVWGDASDRERAVATIALGKVALAYNVGPEDVPDDPSYDGDFIHYMVSEGVPTERANAVLQALKDHVHDDTSE